MKDAVTVPMDIYDSPQEMVLILPLGGVEKSSVSLQLLWNRLVISGKRVQPSLKESLTPMQEHCFWWDFSSDVDLPANAAVDRIWSELSPENILHIVVPKIITPESIVVNIQ